VPTDLLEKEKENVLTHCHWASFPLNLSLFAFWSESHLVSCSIIEAWQLSPLFLYSFLSTAFGYHGFSSFSVSLLVSDF
jgi:hypothetical protein